MVDDLGSTPDARLARELWVLLEAVHSVVYFTPESAGAQEAVGLRGFWRGYFAQRAAPLGAVEPAVVSAVFFGFAPRMVGRSLPAVWATASPAAVVATRTAGAVTALRTHAGADDGPAVAAAAAALRPVVAAIDPAGRPLGAANAALPWPDEPLAALWQAATALREHRGDGHVALLTAEGLTGLDAQVLRAADEDYRERLQAARGFTDAEWDAAAAALTATGLLADGRPTAAGKRLRTHVEERTDALAAPPWAALPAGGADLVRAAVGPLAARLAGGAVPYPNPTGAPAPPAA